MGKVIAVDFDGTIVSHMYPKIGVDNPNAIRVLKKLIEQGHQLILWTMRSGPELDEAVTYCKDQGKGVFVLYDLQSKELHVSDPQRAKQRFTPASTFKVLNALIALQTRLKGASASFGANPRKSLVSSVPQPKPSFTRPWKRA